MLPGQKIFFCGAIFVVMAGVIFSCSEDDRRVDPADGPEEFPQPPSSCADLGIEFGLDVDGERSGDMLPMDETDFLTVYGNFINYLAEHYLNEDIDDLFSGLDDEFWESIEGFSLYSYGCGPNFYGVLWKTGDLPGRQGFSLLLVKFYRFEQDVIEEGHLAIDIDDLSVLFPQNSSDTAWIYPEPATVLTQENARFYGRLDDDYDNRITMENFSFLNEDREMVTDYNYVYGDLDLNFIGEGNFAGNEKRLTGDFCSFSLPGYCE